MIVINTNVNAHVTMQSLARNERAMSTSMERLGTGLRLNSAADDAAGLQISGRMTAQINGLHQAIANAHDAISMLQTTEQMMADIQSIIHRIRELAVQGTNGTNTGQDRAAIDVELQQLIAEAWRISDNTQFNGINLGNGTIGDASGHVHFQVGTNTGQTISVDFNQYWELLGLPSSMTVPAYIAALKADPLDFNTQTGSQFGISAGDLYLQTLSTVRTTIGATINRLGYSIDNLSQTLLNAKASRSRVLDADYARETAALARTQIMSQAGVAMLAQANQQPITVLQLLRA